MASFLGDIMLQEYLNEHGVVNVRAVLGRLREKVQDPVRALKELFENPAESRWRSAVVDGMRALAAEGQCDDNDAMVLFEMTKLLALELGTDEYFKTINAVAASSRTAPALLFFIKELLNTRPLSEEDRWLIFYAVGMVSLRRTVKIPPQIRNSLIATAEEEPIEEKRKEYQRLIESVAR